MCKPGFSSDDLGDEFCYRPNCYVHSDLRMQKGCVPVFQEGRYVNDVRKLI